jgi:glutathione-specific gamma-glutamylcyclotransferase
MWIFGYGSLMWDGWETSFDCKRRITAVLPGYRRTFNKGSVKNWGTAAQPGPTLNLTADTASNCRGIAFEFPDLNRERILAALQKREGKGFKLEGCEGALDDGSRIVATTPIYAGRNVLQDKLLGELAEMILAAHGSSGSCLDYFEGVAKKLAELDVEDAAVVELSQAIEEAKRLKALEELAEQAQDLKMGC